MISLYDHSQDRTVYSVHCTILGTCLSENSEVNVFALEFIKDFSAVVRTLLCMLFSSQL